MTKSGWPLAVAVIGSISGCELLRLHKAVLEFYPEPLRATHLVLPFFALKCHLWPFLLAALGCACLVVSLVTDRGAAGIRRISCVSMALAVVLMLATVSGYVIAFMPMTPYRGEKPMQSAEPATAPYSEPAARSPQW